MEVIVSRQVKCNKCGHVGDYDDFPKDRDFFQKSYIRACPKCDNHQSPGDASMRMFDRERPFSFVNEHTSDHPVEETFRRAEQAS